MCSIIHYGNINKDTLSSVITLLHTYVLLPPDDFVYSIAVRPCYGLLWPVMACYGLLWPHIVSPAALGFLTPVTHRNGRFLLLGGQLSIFPPENIFIFSTTSVFLVLFIGPTVYIYIYIYIHEHIMEMSD